MLVIAEKILLQNLLSPPTSKYYARLSQYIVCYVCTNIKNKDAPQNIYSVLFLDAKVHSVLKKF